MSISHIAVSGYGTKIKRPNLLSAIKPASSLMTCVHYEVACSIELHNMYAFRVCVFVHTRIYIYIRLSIHTLEHVYFRGYWVDFWMFCL